MEVLITGAFGTIGSHAVAALAAAGHRVTCFDLEAAGRRARTALPTSVRVLHGDVTDAAAVARAVRGKDAVVHLAAILPPASEARPALAEAVNVGGTRNVLQAIEREAPSALLVFASSVSVHGYSAGREPPLRVDAPLDGRDDYARHKIACEEMIRASGVRSIVLRIGPCADPGDTSKGGDPATAIAALFAIAPETRVEFLHPEDAADAIVAACTREEAIGRTLFLGSGASSQLTWREFVSTPPRALGLGDFPPDWFGDAPYYTDWMDTAESERLLGYQRRGYPAYAAAVAQDLRWARRMLAPARPLVRFELGRVIAAIRRRRR